MKSNGITPGQLKKLHTLLNQAGLMKHKAELVYSYSGGRIASSRELTSTEARALIAYLDSNDERRKIIRCIWRLAFDCGIIYDSDDLDMSINAGKIDVFCKTRGTVKKALSIQNLSELKRTHRQFESIYKRCQEKKQKEQYIEDLREALRICTENEEYEKSSILYKELELITTKPKGKRNERVSIK